MRDWKKQRTYCNGCHSWRENIQHRDCPKGERGSICWIDLNSFEIGCNKCNDTWKLENNTFYCSCGHVQKTRYQDEILGIEVGDRVLAEIDGVLYVLKRSGQVVVGRRSFPDFDVED